MLDDPVGEMMLDETERGRLLDSTEQPGMYVDRAVQNAFNSLGKVCLSGVVRALVRGVQFIWLLRGDFFTFM